MLDQELLLERTESYLKALVAEASTSLRADFDSAAPFGELGIDSFRVLKIIKSLEADFGTLPKTLLFENFNVDALARYFVDKHRQTVSRKFASEPRSSLSSNAPVVERRIEAPVATSQPAARAGAVRLLEADIHLHPDLDAQVQDLFARYKAEGCVSRGTRNIAPNLFIGSERRGYFNYGRSKDIVLVYAYTGPEDYFPTLALEMQQYCAGKNYQLNLFADRVIETIGDVRFSSTPFGVLQRVMNIGDFTLEGGAMRRLRYQVSKFEKSGACRTLEYQCGTDQRVDQDIARVIDAWCAGKTMVNPLIHIVREEILAGRLHPQHRLFLTYIDDTLHNVILISAMSSTHNGYLMDLEFYTPEMPLGGLEFAIVKIIEALVAEGRGMLSLGGTYGCRLESCANADPGIDKILDDLHRQNIFNDEGNLQFKNKFRPENRTIYLCRAAASGNADNIIDIIMMIADPAKAQSSDAENFNVTQASANVSPANVSAPVISQPAVLVGEERSRTLAECGFNPLNIPADQVEIDLKTDSWAQLKTPAIDSQLEYLRSQLQQPVNVNDSLKAIFPFSYFLLTDAGRSAERLLCKAWPKKGVVLQNLLFPTGIYHQIDNGFTPCELPDASVFEAGGSEPFKGNLSWDGLQAAIAQHGSAISFVCIEVGNNAAGGQPVSISHLRQVKDLLARHAIALVIDCTRILENAQLLIEREPEQAGKSIWVVAREILAFADVLVGSLAKDFCINKGGLIATSDESLLRRLQDVAQQEGGGLDVIDKKLIALAVQNRKQIEARVLRRMEAAKAIWQALHSRGVPVSQPAGGHCVLIDVGQVHEFKRFEQPVASFLAWLYLNTGIRAGAHSVGMQKNSAINAQVRLAISVGTKADQVQDIIERLGCLFDTRKNIPELAVSGFAAESFGDVHANYCLVKYHNVSATQAGGSAPPADVVAEKPAAAPTLMTPIRDARPPQPSTTKPEVSQPKASGGDIAIVGMAGRYPKAKNLEEFWDNLSAGKDCVGDLPPERLARRAQNEFTQTYRGGFLEDVDKFDSLFFNISPREAEVLDPQERLFLEVAWEAIEDAGYYPDILAPEGTPRNVGVFVGAVWAMYQIVGVEQKLSGNNVNPNSFLWGIANRVSYWMNLSGPSLTLDTACSSSLTAIYLACEAIRNGDCSSAIVGGVNLDLHQHKFDINRAGGALSSDGVCRSFGSGANGYVAGEGVGAIFIKPLEQALRDNDNIYGMIKSAVVNHGGRTSGYTVPSPKAQAELIATALEKAKVDARSIGYIEAHGTGTELGDPIEISGLTSAFESHRVGQQSCPIGSVKTNIGHLEAAAGMVGVCKVLLQMKHRQLAPSLHSAQLNELIDFNHSPFFVQQQLAEWRETEIDGRKQPLRAGISSFGAGGANAHIIVEKHELQSTEELPQSGGYVFPLSARNDDQLREMAHRLHQHLDRSQQSLNDIAFTLQNGRKSFEHRVAIIANSRSELRARLNSLIEGRKDADVLTGHAKNSEGITKLLSRREKEQFVGLLAQSRDPHKLAQLWIDGLLSDCRGFPQHAGRRVSLPTYPFADKRHWIGSDRIAATASLQPRSLIHPLIDSNESTFQRQVFKKTFLDRDYLTRDHVVSGVPTLPGTAYLDMARKAGELAGGRKIGKVKNVTWVSPLTVNGAAATDAYIELKPAADSVHFEVFGTSEDGKKRLYSQGKLVYTEESTNAAAEYIDIDGIRARCAEAVSGKDAYPLFKSFGLDYGPSFQVLQQVFKNQDEVLGLLKLPDVRAVDFDDFVLHPCILDASMQAGVVGQLGDVSGEMKVPYSIGEVELLHPLTRTCYSYVTKVKSDRAGSGLSRENVAICDETGKVLVRIRESVGVPLVSVHEKPAPVASEASPRQDEEFSQLYYSPAWEASMLEHQGAIDSLLLFDANEDLRKVCNERGIKTALVMSGDTFADLEDFTYRVNPQDREDYVRLFESLQQKQWSFDSICYASAERAAVNDAAALTRALDLGVHAFLSMCQALIDRKPAGQIRLQYLYFGTNATPQPHHEAMNGFVRTLQLENPKIHCKVLELQQRQVNAAAVLDAMLAEAHPDALDAVSVRYQEQIRYVRKLKKLELPAPAATIPLKEHGVYLITGGAGGLGLIFAEFLAKQYRGRLVLTGRSEISASRAAQLDQLKELGAEVVYIAADVSDADDVRRLVRECKARFGGINGIIHGAGVLRDSYLRKKTREEMAAVFAPKVFGAFHLDQQTQGDDLDFFVTFSSLAAIGGNAGQCDYSFANHYLDSFAAAREALRESGSRSGRTLSLNWSLWADGGMKLDEQTEIFFRKNLGIHPLRKDTGLDGFVRGLLSNRSQLAVLEGVQAKIEQAWGLTKKETVPPATVVSEPVAAAAGNEDLPGQVTRELSRIVMELLKLDASELSLDSILIELGFDSIGLTTFANAINDKYQLDINPVLFFEYPSIKTIAGVLAIEHAGAVRKVHGGGSSAATSAQPAVISAKREVSAESYVAINKIVPAVSSGARELSPEHRFANEPIAIVGIAGVMPQSSNLEEFWDNLKNGRNMVTDIPRDRWIWEDYHGNPVKEMNKSNSKWGGFMKEVDKFDPLFFGITPREAEMMDPQQRIFIETVWSAIEDSGHKVSDLSGTKTGLFVGVSAKDYIDVLAEHQASLDGFSASGNSHSILANRISFLFNLRGPSAPIDTACSSSLIALHRAIESIHTGSSDMAIVGGVQVMLTPIAHISLSSAGMLSVDGKCKTFDKDANGYVRGEGCGVIFIKPLAKAEADGNPIYAVIKATAENHGGRVTMLTAPNPKAQAELLTEAYDKAQIDPTTVGYIECHGTGTSLGDPIEIQALKKAFSDLYRKHDKPAAKAPHCGLSSVKTNIGHLEPAAGIASLLKVLLAIKHGHIPALLHFEELNPYIDLNNSPFYIVDKTTPWERLHAADGTVLPRRAGVSSFGWGGANAHIVLEEYFLPAPAKEDETLGPKLIVLSAKSEDRLKAYARSLLAHVQKHSVELADLAYTLQVGRDPLEERLGLVVNSMEQLEEKLSAFGVGAKNIEDLHRGRVSRYKRNEQGLSVAEATADNGNVTQWMATQNFSRLLEAWVGGAEVDWNKLHAQPGHIRPRRASLPTYPFARDRNWIDTSVKKGTKQQAAASALHPLVHSNISTLRQQSYSSTFTSKELVLNGAVRMLPAAAYLEMARAAVANASPALAAASTIELLNAQWSPAVALSENTPVIVDLLEGRDGQINYEIHSAGVDSEGQARKLIHCQGSAAFTRRPEAVRLDIDQLRSQMRYGKLDEGRLDVTAATIKAIHRGEQQLLVKLELPAAMRGTEADYVLHPSIADGALQALSILTRSATLTGLESLSVISSCTHEMYAWIRYSRGSHAGDESLKLDVDLTDGQGAICMRLKAFTFNNERAEQPIAERSDDFSLLLDSIYRKQAETEFTKLLEDIL